MSQQQLVFPENTPILVKRAIARLVNEPRPIRLFFGCQETGRDWCVLNDTIGRLQAHHDGRPILVKGGADGGKMQFQADKIVRIMDVRAVEDIYVHDEYHLPKHRVVRQSARKAHSNPWVIERAGEGVIADFTNDDLAYQYVDFIAGKVMRRK